jgi:hypothetical protein
MAFDFNFKVTLSTDKTYITIINDETDWGDGINSPANFTSLKVKILGEDKDTALKTITLTASERLDFNTGIDLEFNDSRFYNDTYAPDNYYVVYLLANSTKESNWDGFEIHLGLEESVHINNATVNLRPQNLFEITNNVQAVIALDTMTNLANETYSPDREYRWRALYSHIVDNIINKY